MLHIKDCYYCFDYQFTDPPTILVTSKKYWDEHREIDACLFEVDGLEDWYNVSGGCWEYAGKYALISSIRKELMVAGATHSEDMNYFINYD